MTREEDFLAQLPVIDQVISWVCGRRCLRGADAEDFASAVRMRLVENDYEVLARFERRSSLKTYLTAVITRLYLDFQVERFGKWRASAEARRMGPLALRLECLVYRDGLSFHEACGVLRSDPRVNVTPDALHAIFGRLPQRVAPARVTAGGEPPVEPEPTVERSERQRLAERTFATIRRTLSLQPARDRLFLKLHFESGMTVAEVARTLGSAQKLLYRRKEDILKCLRRALEQQGIGRDEARELLSSLDWDAVLSVGGPEDVLAPEKVSSRPSKEVS